jgi:hypothetical protein
VCVREREYVCEREREKKGVHVCGERERLREGVRVCVRERGSTYQCVCMCVTERE